MQGKPRAGIDLGDEVVIVRVKPLGHLERLDRCCAPRHREVALMRSGGNRRVAVRHGADHHGSVENVVVEREVIAGNDIHPRSRRAFDVFPTKAGRYLIQILGRGPARPVTLKCLLQLSMGADAGKAKDRCLDHEISPPVAARVARPRSAVPRRMGGGAGRFSGSGSSSQAPSRTHLVQWTLPARHPYRCASAPDSYRVPWVSLSAGSGSQVTIPNHADRGQRPLEGL